MTGELLRTADIVIGWLAVLLGVGFAVVPRAPLRYRQIAVLLSIGLAVRYVLWRAFFTLNHATVLEAILSHTLLLAEMYGLSYLMVFYMQCWKRPDRAESPPVSEHAPSVDVFITVLNEPIEILFRTALCCTRLDYPSKRVYILDDGAQNVPEPSNMSKARIHAFLASRERPALRVGEAAEVGYWPFENPVFGQVREFLRVM